MSRTRREWACNGIDGANPLGFLAAVGLLRTATMAWPDGDPTLRWQVQNGCWRPFLSLDGASDKDALLDGLHSQLTAMQGHFAFTIGDDLKFSPETFRDLATTARGKLFDATPDPRAAEFLGAFACEAFVDDDGYIQDTAFRTMRGAGHQHFIKTMRDLALHCTRHHIERSLFSPWTYQDERLGLRIDPAENRQHALCWTAPNKQPAATEWGANRLAVEALPLFPVQPTSSGLGTVGFTQRPGEGVFFTWPIWEPAIGLDPLRSLLALGELQEKQPDRRILRCRGVVEVFRCQRITSGKYRNFTPAVPA